jgi:tetratricopeptide (TPR) repeat protein
MLESNPAADSLAEMPLAGDSSHLRVNENGTAPFVESQNASASREASPLPSAQTARERSLQLEQVAQQADRQTRHGCELAGRGAYFAARSKFVGSLRLMAEGLDSEQKTNQHCRALAAATTALKEAEDFLPSGSRLESELNLSEVLAAHATPILKGKASQVTAMTALRSYLTFAQEQFSAAVGHEVAGSMALHAMGKLHATLARKKIALVAAPESKAMVFYQAALLVYPKNPMASNDLGVLLAQCGHYAEARPMLERSVSLCPQSTGWQNLAVVYRQLNQPALAERAANQAASLRQAELAQRRQSPVSSNGAVEWVDPQMFAQTTPGMYNEPRTIPPPEMRADALPVGQPLSSRNVRPSLRSLAEANRSATTVRRIPETHIPSSAPATAGRTSWGPPVYQR